MIHLHHPDGRSVWVNPDLIERFECDPQVLMMVDGGRIEVRETPDEITDAVQAHRVGVIRALEARTRATSAPAPTARANPLTLVKE